MSDDWITFLANDPNISRAVFNNPVSLTDPTGMQPPVVINRPTGRYIFDEDPHDEVADFLDTTYEPFDDRNKRTGTEAGEAGQRELLNVAGVGVFVSAGEACSGKDAFNGRQLSASERRWAAFWSLLGFGGMGVADDVVRTGVKRVSRVEKIERAINDSDDCLWVVEGDVPSAYFVVDESANPVSAFTVYCEMMEEWVEAVNGGLPLDDVFPVAARPTKKNADQLNSRVKFIRERLIPTLQ